MGVWESFYSRTVTPSGAVVHKVKIHFFLYFSCVRRSVRSSSSGWTAAAPTVLLDWRFCPVGTRRENNIIMTSVMTLSPRRVTVGLACEAGRSTWCREFVGVTASSAVRSMLMSPWMRDLQEAELVGKVPPVYPLNDKSVECGGWETRVVVAREGFWDWALSSLCVWLIRGRVAHYE